MSTFATTEPVLQLIQGSEPLLLSIPHAGTFIPAALKPRLTDAALAVPDTDWHLPLLYDFARELGASVLVATHSRYVVDLNRPPDNANLYPGQDTTGLCPIDTFTKDPLYRQPGDAPGDTEIAQRAEAIWHPYHQTLQAELQRLQALHGEVALWDAHSIAGVLPRFFEGRLPDLNLGTADGKSCDAELARQLLQQAQASDYSAVLNGRFKGGYITRQYGAPADGVQAIQLEMAFESYMQPHAPFAWEADKATRIQPLLRQLLQTVLAYVKQRQARKVTL